MSQADRTAAKIEELERNCHQHGLPMTAQRREVLHALALRSDHPTADQVFADVRKRLPEISRATVYRVLETLVRIGIVSKVCHPGSAARYEVARRRHHHLVCISCEKMIDLEDPTLDHLSLPGVGSGFHIQDYSVQFRGLCTTCAKKQKGQVQGS
jgi:Fur family peroxide stress response transcriptional regulator